MPKPAVGKRPASTTLSCDASVVKRPKGPTTSLTKPKGFADLPREILDQILNHILPEYPLLRRLWASSMLTTSRAFHSWLLPVTLGDTFLVSEADTLYGSYSDNDYTIARLFGNRDVWRHLAQRLGPSVGPLIKVLKIDRHSLEYRHALYLLDFLRCCLNISALAIDDLQTAEPLFSRYVAHTEEHSTFETRVRPEQDSQAPSVNLASQLRDDLDDSFVLKKVQRIVIADAHMCPCCYENVFVDPATGLAIFPNLTSLFWFFAEDDHLGDFETRPLKTLLAICSNHKRLKHLELHFEQDIDSWSETGLPFSHRVKNHITALRDFVRQANVSVTLYHDSYCYYESFKVAAFYHTETIGDNTLRVFDIAGNSAEDLWLYKADQLTYCRDSSEGHLSFDDFSGNETFDDYTYSTYDSDDADDRSEIGRNEMRRKPNTFLKSSTHCCC